MLGRKSKYASIDHHKTPTIDDIYNITATQFDPFFKVDVCMPLEGLMRWLRSLRSTVAWPDAPAARSSALSRGGLESLAGRGRGWLGSTTTPLMRQTRTQVITPT